MPEQSSFPRPVLPTWALSIEMLLAALGGATYDRVAEEFGVTRTAVQKRVNFVAARLAASGAIEGLNSRGATSIRRLRKRRDEVAAALQGMSEPEAQVHGIRFLTNEEIVAGGLRVRRFSHQVCEDVALYYMLFTTGARPLEIARMEVRDYLRLDGSVRRASELPVHASITRRARPLYFASVRLDHAMDEYLAERLAKRRGLGDPGSYRGLAPDSRLFLSATGTGFEFKAFGSRGQVRYRCRAIQETYAKLFRYAGFDGVTALSVRHMVADRLYRRGADDAQVGHLLGITEASDVREQFPRRLLPLDELTRDLV